MEKTDTVTNNEIDKFRLIFFKPFNRDAAPLKSPNQYNVLLFVLVSLLRAYEYNNRIIYLSFAGHLLIYSDPLSKLYRG